MNAKMNPWIVLLLVVLLCGTVQAQEKMQKVKIASGGHVVHFLPLDLAVALGYFKDEGLEPKITYLKGGTATAQALISKQVDFSTNSIDHAFKAAAQGKDGLRMVVLLNQTPGMVLVVDSKHRNKVNTIADLKGMRLGVTSLGSATHMVLAFLLSKTGVDLDDVTIVKVGTSTFPPALKNGNIDGGIAIEPFASMMVEQGDAFVLQRMITAEDSQKAFGGPYNLTGILTRQDVIDSKPELVQKLVNVHVRALKWIHDHSEEEVADALSSEVVGSDKERYVKILKTLKNFFSPNGMLSEEGATNVLAAMKASGVLSKDFTGASQKYMDTSFSKRSPVGSTVSTSVGQQESRTLHSPCTLLVAIVVAIGLLALVLLIIKHSRRRKNA